MTDPIRPFKEEKKTVPMHIYDADPEDAKWFKQWCDVQGIKFNMGIKLVRLAVEKDTMYRNIMDVLANHEQSIDSLREALTMATEKPKEPENKIKKRFGSNLKKDGD